MYTHNRRSIYARLLAVPFGIAALAAALPASADVTPVSVTATKNPGESFTVNKVVTTPAIPPKPDIVFLADTTGSMGDAIASVRSGATGIMNLVRASQPDSQFGVASYRDVGSSYVYRLEQAVTSSIPDAQAGINSWVADEGGDTPEAQLFALTQVAGAATGFRSGSSRVLVWFGDAPGHDPRLGATEASAIAALQAAEIRVIAISTGVKQLDASGQATRITAATGGLLRSTLNDSEVAAAIEEALQNLPVTVSPVVTCDPGLSLTLAATSPETVVSGADVTYTETITVDPAHPGGTTLNCTVKFLLNGLEQTGFTQTVAVTVNGADMAIVKTGPALVTEGNQFNYDLAVTNNGLANATGVVVSDPLPANTTFVSASPGCVSAAGVVTCTIGAMPAGSTESRTITVRAGSSGSSIVNTATVAADQSDPLLSNNTSTATTTLNHNPVCTEVTAGPNLWPPNHKLRNITLSGATDSDGDPLTWVVNGVTQDEPTNGLGDGDTAIDAVLGSGNQLQVRAERSGLGDGRVYRIAFTVTDGRGGQCTGVATVGVPHNQSPSGRTPIDSGGVFNSLV